MTRVSARALKAALVAAATAGAFGQMSREKFPAEVAFEDATYDDYEEYLRGVIIFTFGAGIGLAVLIWLLMFCCCMINCCRGPPAKNSKKKQQQTSGLYSSLQQRVEKFEGQSKNTTALWIGLAIITAIQLGCAAGVYFALGETNVYVVDMYEGAQTLTVDFAGFLCTEQEVDDNTNCNDETIGDFLENGKIEIGDGFDSMVTWLESLDMVTDATEDVGVAVDALTVTAYTLERQANWMEGNTTLAIDTLDQLSDPSNPDTAVFSDELPSTDSVPALDDTAMDNINEGIDLLITSSETLSDLEDTLTEILEDEVQAVIERIDGEGENDDRNSIMETLDDLLENVFDFQGNVLDADKSMEDGKDVLEVQLENARHAATILFAIPPLLLLFCTLCGWRCKTARPVRLNMLGNFFCQEFCAIVTGLMMLSAIIVTDICDSHVEVIQVNLNNSVTIGNSKVILGDVVMDVLTCSGDENLAEILTITDEFNVSSEVEGVLEDIDKTIQDFTDQFEEVDKMLGEAQDAVDALTDVEINEGDSEAAINDIDELLGLLPPSPYVDSPENEAKLKAMYDDDQGGSYDVDTEAGKNDAIAANDRVVEDLNTIKSSLLNIDQLTTDISQSLEQINDDFARIESATDNLTDTLDTAVDGLDIVKDGLQQIVDYVATGPDYLGCKFIGDFYSTTIEGTMCTDLEGSLNLQYIPMLILTIFILIGFCYAGYYTPHMKKQKGPSQVQPTGVSPQGDIQLVHVRASDQYKAEDMLDPGKGDREV